MLYALHALCCQSLSPLSPVNPLRVRSRLPLCGVDAVRVKFIARHQSMRSMRSPRCLSLSCDPTFACACAPVNHRWKDRFALAPCCLFARFARFALFSFFLGSSVDVS